MKPDKQEKVMQTHFAVTVSIFHMGIPVGSVVVETEIPLPLKKGVLAQTLQGVLSEALTEARRVHEEQGKERKLAYSNPRDVTAIIQQVLDVTRLRQECPPN